MAFARAGRSGLSKTPCYAVVKRQNTGHSATPFRRQNPPDCDPRHYLPALVSVSARDEYAAAMLKQFLRSSLVIHRVMALELIVASLLVQCGSGKLPTP